MIYLDTSVALAHLLSADRRPPDLLWEETVVSSRLLEYELWNRLHARGSETTHGEHARDLRATMRGYLKPRGASRSKSRTFESSSPYNPFQAVNDAGFLNGGPT